MSDDLQKDLVKKLLEASNQIHRASTKGSGNFIITSSQVAKSFTLMYVGERIEKCKEILARIKNEQTN